MPELLACYDGRVIGIVRQTPKTTRLSFTYDDDWRDAAGAFPVSLSLPLAQSRHGDAAVRIVLEGCLPDRTDVRARLAQEHSVAADDPFGLLRALGKDCAGAIQYVVPSSLADLQADDGTAVVWLSDVEVASRLSALREPGAPARYAGDVGYFSLAGAQPKIALCAEGGRWGIPSGRRPTTHILKPPMGDRVECLIAEHVALELAMELDLRAAKTFPLRVDDKLALVVERYDRVQGADGKWRRLHQEDVCQALGLSPSLKYEVQAAPGARGVAELLWQRSTNPNIDVTRLYGALALNWLIVGTDAHVRNYSLLLGNGGAVRLAPFYDMASALTVVAPAALATAKMAMQIGGEYVALHVGISQWRSFEVHQRVQRDAIIDVVARLLHDVPEAVERVRARACAAAVLPMAHVDALADAIVTRARLCQREVSLRR